MSREEDIKLILKLRGFDQQVEQDLAQLAIRDQANANAPAKQPFNLGELIGVVVFAVVIVVGLNVAGIKPLDLLQQQIDKYKAQPTEPAPTPTESPAGVLL